jgi:hypothetical protein
VTPVDHGEVCLNYDRSAFESLGLAPPDDLDDLVDPAYRGLTVVQNPATSSPGSPSSSPPSTATARPAGARGGRRCGTTTCS